MKSLLKLLLLLGAASALGGDGEDGPTLVEAPQDHVFREPFDRPGLENPWSLSGATTGSAAGSPQSKNADSAQKKLTKPHQFTGFVNQAIKQFSPVDEQGKPIWKPERKPVAKPPPAKALLPVAYDGSVEDILTPKKAVGFWYSEDGETQAKGMTGGPTYDGHIRFDMKADTVPLSFSDKIAGLKCLGVTRSSFSLDVLFNSETDVARALQAWNLQGRGNTNPFFFAAVFPSECLPRGPGVKSDAVSFAKYIGFNAKGLSLVITMQHTPYDQAIVEMEAYIGAAPPEVAADIVSDTMEGLFEKDTKMIPIDEALGISKKSARKKRDIDENPGEDGNDKGGNSGGQNGHNDQGSSGKDNSESGHHLHLHFGHHNEGNENSGHHHLHLGHHHDGNDAKDNSGHQQDLLHMMQHGNGEGSSGHHSHHHHLMHDHHHHSLREKIHEKLEKLEQHIKEMIRHVRKKIKKVFSQHFVNIREKTVVIDWTPKHNKMSEEFPGRMEVALPRLTDHLFVSCVECYAKSQMRYAGRVVWQPGGRSDASFWMQGPLEVQAQLGLVTTGILELAHEIPLIEIPLQPYVFPGLVHVGPMFSIEFELGVEVVGEMKMVVGANVKWEEMSTTVNLHRAPKHIVGYGWKPTFTPLLSIDGNFEIDAFAGISANLKFGVSVINGNFHFDVRAADRVTARTGFSIEGREFHWDHKEKEWTFSKPMGDKSLGLVTGSKKCEGGLEMHTGFRNEVMLIAFHWIRKTLHRWNFKVRHHCVKFGTSAERTRKNTKGILSDPPKDSGTAPTMEKMIDTWPEMPNYGAAIIKNPDHPDMAMGYSSSGQHLGLVSQSVASENSFANDDDITIIDTSSIDRDGNDAPGAYLVGFKNEIDEHGVTRLRTTHGPNVPSEAFFVSLTNGKKDGEIESEDEHDNRPAIVAVTTRDDDESVLMVINCFYADGRTRAFLAKDLEKATEFLAKPSKEQKHDSKRIRGGGVVQDCMVLSWKLSPLEVAGDEPPLDSTTLF